MNAYYYKCPGFFFNPRWYVKALCNELIEICSITVFRIFHGRRSDVIGGEMVYSFDSGQEAYLVSRNSPCLDQLAFISFFFQNSCDIISSKSTDKKKLAFVVVIFGRALRDVTQSFGI